MERSKNGIIILSVLLLGFVVLLIATFVDRGMWTMRRMIPQAIRVFEQSRESLELLRDGGLAANNGWADNHPNAVGIGITYSLGEDWKGIDYIDWHTIEWLSDEERDAIVFLLTSDELERNFVVVSSMSATLYRRGMGLNTDVMVLLYPGAEPREVPFMQDSYIKDLGNGYRLWFYTARSHRGLDEVLIIAIRLLFVVIIILISIRLHFFVKRYKESTK